MIRRTRKKTFRPPKELHASENAQQLRVSRDVSLPPAPPARGLKALLESMPEFEIPERVRTIRVRKIEF